MAKEISLTEFGIQYFDKRSQTRGNRNPVRRRKSEAEPRKKRSQIRAEIKEGKHDNLLKVCGISGKPGRFQKTIKPAIVRLSKAGGFDTYKVLIHQDLEVGDTHNCRTILSIVKNHIGATIKVAQVGKDIRPYVHVYRIQPV